MARETGKTNKSPTLYVLRTSGTTHTQRGIMKNKKLHRPSKDGKLWRFVIANVHKGRRDKQNQIFNANSSKRINEKKYKSRKIKQRRNTDRKKI